MRLSRARLLLRVALLAGGGGYLLWRASQARRAAGELAGPAALASSRLALLWALVGILALVTALAASMSLRKRPPRRPLRLGGGAGRDGTPRPGHDQ